MRNGFIRKKVGSLTLGEKLRKLRGAGRISLNEVSKQTKIQVKYLEYLENGEYENMPADVYVRGFLRSYAQYLGVNEKQLIKLYEREKRIHSNIKNIGDTEKLVEPINFSKFSITPKKIIASVIACLVLGSFIYLYNELDTFVSTPRLVVLNPNDGMMTEDNSVHVNGETDPGIDVFINDQPTLVNSDGEFSEKVGLQEGFNNIAIKAVNRFDKESIRNITIQSNHKVETEDNTDVNKDNMSSDENRGLGFSVEVSVGSSSTWISVEVDDNLVYSGILLPQASQFFEAREKISITSSKGNNTFIKINGEDKGSLGGNPGVIRDVTFTADTINN